MNNWLTQFYEKNPEYRALRVAKRTRDSIHFEIEPGKFQAHLTIRPKFERTQNGLWMPVGGLTQTLRLAQRLVRDPRALAKLALFLPLLANYSAQPDATAGQDCLVFSTQATWNYGAHIAVNTNTTLAKGLVKFDVSSIPSHATCTAATLKLYQMLSGAASAFTVTIYQIAAGNAGWTEGTKNGALAGAGEPCWNALAADGSGGVTTAWAGAAGLATSGTDYEASSLGSASGNRSDANGTEYAIALSASRVQQWWTAASNYGMLSVMSAPPGQMGSSDNATAGRRPAISIDYAISDAPRKANTNRSWNVGWR